MKKLFIIFLSLASLLISKGQEETEKKNFGITFSGFVKHDAFFDTRQTVAAREGHFLLWPSAKLNDENGDDINAVSGLNMLAVQSRLSGKITGPDAFGAKTSGVIEGDFFAQLNDNINLFRLRHAFLKLNWTNTELLVGQYWNPLFVTGCFPGTVSFNTGTPLQSFARNPQIRVTQSIGNLKFIGAVLSQRDYASRGIGGPSSDYLRNSAIPDLHAQIQYSTKNETSGTSFLIGAGVAYKTIVPRLSNTVEISPETNEVVVTPDSAMLVTTKAVTKTYKVSESVSGLSGIAYTKIKFKPVTIKLQYRYGENIADVLSVSGFAVKEEVDAVSGELSYTPLVNQTIWGEIHTNGKKLQVGVFGGYLLNMGTKEAMSSVKNDVYGLGTNIHSLLRISPRVMWNSNKVRVALEVEFTEARYGVEDTFNDYYVPEHTSIVQNYRTNLSTYYFF